MQIATRTNKKQMLSEVFSTIIADSDLNEIMNKRNCGLYVKVADKDAAVIHWNVEFLGC